MQLVADELVRLSGTTLDASVTLAEDWAGSQAGLAVPDSAAGNTLQAPSVLAGAARVADAAGVAVGRLVATLQADADRLQVVAFDVSTVDDDVARRLAGMGEPRRSGVQ